MAKAIKTVTTRKVEKVITVDEPQTTITLTLTQEEADFVRNLIGWVVVGKGPLREISNSVFNSLVDCTAMHGSVHYDGSVTLKDGPITSVNL